MKKSKMKHYQENDSDDIDPRLKYFIIAIIIIILVACFFGSVAVGYDWYPGRWFNSR